MLQAFHYEVLFLVYIVQHSLNAKNVSLIP